MIHARFACRGFLTRMVYLNLDIIVEIHHSGREPSNCVTEYTVPFAQLLVWGCVGTAQKIFGSFCEAGGHRVGFHVMQVINSCWHIAFNCHLSAKIKILLVKL